MKTASLSNFNTDALVGPKGPLNHSRPTRVDLDGKACSVASWSDAVREFVKFLQRNGKTRQGDAPVPNYSGIKYFINSAPEQRDSRDAVWRAAGDLFVDTKYNAFGHVRNMFDCCRRLGIDPMRISLTLEW